MKHNEQKQRQKIIANIYEHAEKAKRKCIVDGCDEDAINSHLLQRHGILDFITENNHLVEIKPKSVFALKKGEFPIAFNRVGINNAISLYLFCNKHDTELFKPIEGDNPDFTLYNSQLLLTYRSICCELRQKEIIIDKYERMVNASTLSDMRDLNEQLLEQQKLGARDITVYKRLIEQELQAPGENVTFKIFRYPFKGVYASTSFNLLDKPQEEYGDSTLDSVFCHVIPQENDTIIVVGYHKDYTNPLIEKYADSWDGLDNEHLGKKLTDLALRCDSWGMSISWFDKISIEKRNEFMEIQKDYILGPLTTMPESDFNLFEDWL